MKWERVKRERDFKSTHTCSIAYVCATNGLKCSEKVEVAHFQTTLVVV